MHCGSPLSSAEAWKPLPDLWANMAYNRAVRPERADTASETSQKKTLVKNIIVPKTRVSNERMVSIFHGLHEIAESWLKCIWHNFLLQNHRELCLEINIAQLISLKKHDAKCIIYAIEHAAVRRKFVPCLGTNLHQCVTGEMRLQFIGWNYLRVYLLSSLWPQMVQIYSQTWDSFSPHGPMFNLVNNAFSIMFVFRNKLWNDNPQRYNSDSAIKKIYLTHRV